MPNYIWIITEDHLDSHSHECHEGPGVFGPQDAVMEEAWRMVRQHEAESSPNGLHPTIKKFRMYDDDNNLYYEGLFKVLGNPVDFDQELMFAPLDDYGMPNAGAIRIDYLEAGGKWSTL